MYIIVKFELTNVYTLADSFFMYNFAFVNNTNNLNIFIMTKSNNLHFNRMTIKRITKVFKSYGYDILPQCDSVVVTNLTNPNFISYHMDWFPSYAAAYRFYYSHNYFN